MAERAGGVCVGGGVEGAENTIASPMQAVGVVGAHAGPAALHCAAFMWPDSTFCQYGWMVLYEAFYYRPAELQLRAISGLPIGYIIIRVKVNTYEDCSPELFHAKLILLHILWVQWEGGQRKNILKPRTSFLAVLFPSMEIHTRRKKIRRSDMEQNETQTHSAAPKPIPASLITPDYIDSLKFDKDPLMLVLQSNWMECKSAGREDPVLSRLISQGQWRCILNLVKL